MRRTIAGKANLPGTLAGLSSHWRTVVDVASDSIPERREGAVLDFLRNSRGHKPEVATVMLAALGATAELDLDDEIDLDAPREPEPLVPITPRALFTAAPRLREPIIDGLLRRSEIMNLIAASKIGKSWLSLSLALCVATGLAWLGRFSVRHGRVLLIDNELHPETLASRLQRVAGLMNVSIDDYDAQIEILSLRGRLCGLAGLEALFRSVAGRFDLVVLDAGYRFTDVGDDENSNAGVTERYNTLDQFAASSGAAIVYVHHTPKGSQEGKVVTDVGAGAGAQSRAADTHLVLLPDSALEPGQLLVDAAIRSFPPIEPFVIRRDEQLWVADDASPPVRGEGKKRAVDPETFARTYASHEPRSKIDILYRATEDGLSERGAKATLDRAVAEGHRHAWKTPGQRHPRFSTCPQPPTTEAKEIEQ